MENIVSIAAITNTVSQLSPAKCYENIIENIDKVKDAAPDIILFPSLSLCSSSAGSLLRNKSILAECRKLVSDLAEYTKDMNCYVIVGLPLDGGKKIVSAMAVLLGGEILSYVPDFEEHDGLDTYDIQNDFFNEINFHQSFLTGKARFTIVPCNEKNLFEVALDANNDFVPVAKTDIILVPSSGRSIIGGYKNSCDTARALSRSLDCLTVLCAGGDGESSSPYMYNPFVGMFFGDHYDNTFGTDHSNILMMDFDIDMCKTVGGRNARRMDHPKKSNRQQSSNYVAGVKANPFLPDHPDKKAEFLRESFEFQVKSLAARMKNTGIKKAVIGVSGGLDSTVALLATVKAMEQLGLPSENVIGISMPGFGTTKGTKSSAKLLMEHLNITSREISIEKSTNLHFEDIGHDSQNTNVTYENAQARERTQVLMDVANDEDALVVGTGDLSEQILGFCTFGGDHLASYNINASFTKTVLRELLRFHIENNNFSDVSNILNDILNTPISPELLPPDLDGNIIQQTENILGPYEIHEFFAYYFIKYNFSVKKLFFYAKMIFGNLYSDDYMKDLLRQFFKRFISSQFKRSSAPDSAMFIDFPINEHEFYLSSDAEYDFFVKQIDSL